MRITSWIAICSCWGPLLLSPAAALSIDEASPDTLAVCREAETFHLEATVGAQEDLAAVTLQVVLPAGVEYVAGSVTGGSENPAGQPSFDMLIDVDGSGHAVVEFQARARCELANADGASATNGYVASVGGTVVIDDCATDPQCTTDPYTIQAPALELTSSEQCWPDALGACSNAACPDVDRDCPIPSGVGSMGQRRITIRNDGTGALGSFELIDEHDVGIDITGASVEVTSGAASVCHTLATAPNGNPQDVFVVSLTDPLPQSGEVTLVEDLTVTTCARVNSVLAVRTACADGPDCVNSTVCTGPPDGVLGVHVEADPGLPQVTVAFQRHDDLDCWTAGQESFELVIENQGTGPAENVQIDLLKSPFGGYSDFVYPLAPMRLVGPCSGPGPCTGPVVEVPLCPDTDPMTSCPDDAASVPCLCSDFWASSECYPDHPTDHEFYIDRLEAGERYQLEWEGTICCPSDTEEPLRKSHWAWRRHYQNACDGANLLQVTQGNPTYSNGTAITKFKQIYIGPLDFIGDPSTTETLVFFNERVAALPGTTARRFEAEFAFSFSGRCSDTDAPCGSDADCTNGTCLEVVGSGFEYTLGQLELVGSGGEIWLSDGGSENVQTYLDGTVERIVATFSVANAPAAWLDTGEIDLDVLQDSEFRLPLTPVCPAPATTTIDHRLSWTPCSGDCSVPISEVTIPASIHCPGCRRQGLHSERFEIHRVTLGSVDDDDNGVADDFPPVTVDAKTDSRIRDYLATIDDVLEGELHAHVEVNSAYCPWDGSGAGFPLLYGYYQVEVSNGALIDLEAIELEIEITFDVNSSFTVTIPASDQTRALVTDNGDQRTYVYDFSVGKLEGLPGYDSGFTEFDQDDRLLFKPRFRLRKTRSVGDGFVLSVATNFAYVTGQEYGTGSALADVFGAGLHDPSTCDPGLCDDTVTHCTSDDDCDIGSCNNDSACIAPPVCFPWTAYYCCRHSGLFYVAQTATSFDDPFFTESTCRQRAELRALFTVNSPPGAQTFPYEHRDIGHITEFVYYVPPTYNLVPGSARVVEYRTGMRGEVINENQDLPDPAADTTGTGRAVFDIDLHFSNDRADADPPGTSPGLLYQPDETMKAWLLLKVEPSCATPATTSPGRLFCNDPAHDPCWSNQDCAEGVLCRRFCYDTVSQTYNWNRTCTIDYYAGDWGQTDSCTLANTDEFCPGLHSVTYTLESGRTGLLAFARPYGFLAPDLGNESLEQLNVATQPYCWTYFLPDTALSRDVPNPFLTITGPGAGEPGITVLSVTDVTDQNSPIELVPDGAGLYRLADIPPGTRREIEICASYECTANLDPSELTVHEGWTCDPAQLESYPANYPSDCDPAQRIFRLVPQEADLQLSIDDPSGASCEPVTYTALVNATGAGSLSDIAVDVSLPAGLVFADDGFGNLEGSIGFPCDLVDPGNNVVHPVRPIGGGNSASWSTADTASVVGDALIGGAGIDNQMCFFFDVVSDCDYDPGMSLRVDVSALDNCLDPEVRHVEETLEIVDFPEFTEMDVTLSAGPFSDCDLTRTVQVRLENVGGLATGPDDLFEVVLPAGLTYVGGTTTVLGDPDVVDERVRWAPLPTIQPGEVLVYAFDVQRTDPADCGPFDLSGSALIQGETDCTGTGVCAVNATTGSDQLQITVADPDATFSLPPTICAGYPLNVSGSPCPTQSWDFGDGAPPVPGSPVQHTFVVPGSYDVTHTVQDACRSGMAAQTIDVLDCTGCESEQTITGEVTCDNFYALYTANDESPTMNVTLRGTGGNPENGICQAETYGFSTDDRFIYVTAFSDDFAAQGLLHDLRVDGIGIQTGTGGWQVCPTGHDLDGYPAPTTTEIATEVQDCNARGAWVDPVVGGPNGSFNTSRWCGANGVGGIDTLARWTWHDARTCVGDACCYAPEATSCWPGEGDGEDLIDGNVATVPPGITYTSGVAGTAFAFPGGAGNYLFVPFDANQYPDFDSLTIEAWVRTSVSEGVQTILAKNECGLNCSGGNAGARYELRLNDGVPQFRLRDATAAVQVTLSGSQSIANDAWHHVLGTLDRGVHQPGQEARLYINGLQVDSLVPSPPLGAISEGGEGGTADPLMIGALVVPGEPMIVASIFTGQLDQVAYSRRAVDQQEVMARLDCNADDALWPFEPGCSQHEYLIFRREVCDVCPDEDPDDADADGICCPDDNCCDAANPDQADGDADGIGDACDTIGVGPVRAVAVMRDPVLPEIIDLAYVPACNSTDHEIRFGRLQDVQSYGWTGSACGIGTSGSYAGFDPGPDSYFFVVVGTDGGVEGSYGTDGAATERPQYTQSECDRTQVLAEPCP